MQQDGVRFLEKEITEIKVAVIGDMMTDRYITGRVNRISPEAPVPVNLVESQREVPGGAANTAANLAALSCQVYACGMKGNDADGAVLTSLMEQAGIDMSGMICAEHYHTTAKIRILGARQQMMRLDYEEKKNPSPEECRFVLEWLENLLARGLGVIVLSDYGKGMITAGLSEKVIALAQTYKVPVLVDPKGSDWTKYDGAFGITPNLKELSDCVGREIPNDDKAVEEAGKKVR